MRVYLSGAISADKGYYQKFLNAEVAMKKLGHEVINPARVAKALPKRMGYEDFMKIDFALIETCDAVCLLRDWESSSGSRREKEFAESLGKTFIFEKKKNWEKEKMMDKPKCCWNCKYLIALNPEEDECKLDGHIFDDRLILSAMRDKKCPLDNDELKGEERNEKENCR